MNLKCRIEDIKVCSLGRSIIQQKRPATKEVRHSSGAHQLLPIAATELRQFTLL